MSALVPNLRKVEHVLRCVPRLEELLRSVTITVFPEIEGVKDEKLVSEKLDILLETLRER